KENNSLSYIGPPLFQSGYLGAKLCTFGLRKKKKVMLVKIAKEISNYNYTQIEKGFTKYYNDHGNPNEIVKLDIDQTDYLSVAKEMSRVLKSNPDVEVVFVTNSRVFSVAR